MFALIGDLMTETTYTSALRGIIEWYKTAYRERQIQALVQNVLNTAEDMIVTLRVRTSLAKAAESADRY